MQIVTVRPHQLEQLICYVSSFDQIVLYEKECVA